MPFKAKEKAYYQRPEVKERIKKYLQTHKERISKRQKAYRQRPEIKERNSKRRKVYMQRPEVKKKNQERVAKWRKNHPNLKKHQRELYKKSNTSRRATARKYYQKNKEKIQEINIRIYYKLRNVVLEGYSRSIPKCVCCGVKGNEFLAIDHINGRKEMDTEPELKKIGYSSKLEGKKLHTWLRNNNFPKGFQVLCHNCNFAKGQLGKCPHNEN